jgi:WD40 repeat protein
MALDIDEASITALVFSPDGSRLAAAAGTTVRVWDVANGLESKPLELDSSVTALAFSPSGRNLIVGTDSGVAQLWDIDSGVEIRRFGADRSGGASTAISSIAFRPDGRAIAAMVDEKVVYTWDVYGYEAAQDRWPANEGAAFARFSSAGEGFVGVSNGLSRIASGSPATISRRTIEGLPLDVSPDGKRALIYNNGLEILDLEAGDVARDDTAGLVMKAAFAPDGEKILCILQDGIVQIRDGRSAALLREIGPLSGASFAISPTHNQVAGTLATVSVVSEGAPTTSVSLTVLDVATGEMRELPDKNRTIMSMAYSPDGSLLAVGYLDGTLDIRQVSDGQIVRSFAGHSVSVTALAFSADGARLLSGDGVGTVRVWDVASGEALGGFVSQLGSVTHVAISPDGGLIVATSGDGTTVVWQNRSGAALAEWVRANRYVPELSCEERARYNVAPLCAATPAEGPTATAVP